MKDLSLLMCLLGTIHALPLFPQQAGTPGMASVSLERMRRYGQFGMSPQAQFPLNGYNQFQSLLPWQQQLQQIFTALAPWAQQPQQEHQQYEYALPVHPPPPQQPPQQPPLSPQQPEVSPQQPADQGQQPSAQPSQQGQPAQGEGPVFQTPQVAQQPQQPEQMAMIFPGFEYFYQFPVQQGQQPIMFPTFENSPQLPGQQGQYPLMLPTSGILPPVIQQPDQQQPQLPQVPPTNSFLPSVVQQGQWQEQQQQQQQQQQHPQQGYPIQFYLQALGHQNLPQNVQGVISSEEIQANRAAGAAAAAVFNNMFPAFAANYPGFGSPVARPISPVDATIEDDHPVAGRGEQAGQGTGTPGLQGNLPNAGGTASSPAVNIPVLEGDPTGQIGNPQAPQSNPSPGQGGIMQNPDINSPNQGVPATPASVPAASAGNQAIATASPKEGGIPIIYYEGLNHPAAGAPWFP
ncbi:ameloblastin-like isoform X2 [Protopterus annectens]|uniref:ameloblastin-like isoform X2 n=1 Tax=Protopterus annectens TaxID=7888 RepID=UPI001CFB4B23|nr:ameloblastin-like isoform X2 [Protopterus annectens]